jgi:hypothetical protein
MGMGILGSAMQGVGMAGGIATGIMSGNAQEDVAKDMIRMMQQIHEEGSAERRRTSEMARGDAELARRNLLASEQAKMNVLGSLGQPGTYGPSPGSNAGPISLGVLQPTGLGSIYKPGSLLEGPSQSKLSGVVSGEDVALGAKAKWKGKKEWEVTGTNMDPDAIAAEVKDTAGFRTVSRMVAEAEQLMNRSGPLWNELNNSVVGSIYESNAAFHRQAMDEIARGVARGGTARRVGMQMVQAFQAQEAINRSRTSQLWQAKMGLEQYRTQYAQQATSYANAWVNNTAGLRDSFTGALNNLQMFWSQTLAPSLVGATVGAQSATQQGVLNASQGLYDAIATRTATVQGAFQSLYNMGGSMGGQLGGASGGMFGVNQEEMGSGGGGGGGNILSQLMGMFGGGGGGSLAGAGDVSSGALSAAGGLA